MLAEIAFGAVLAVHVYRPEMSPGEVRLLVECPESVAPGWTWDGLAFFPPVVEEPMTDEPTVVEEPKAGQ